MQALAAQDNLAEALAVYSQLSDCLRDQLGVSPSPATRQLYQQLLAATSTMRRNPAWCGTHHRQPDRPDMRCFSCQLVTSPCAAERRDCARSPWAVSITYCDE
jgi:hypothetical protein